MGRSLPMLSSVAVAFAFTAPAAIADELHVPGEYASIQAAINAASEGDEVIVAPGTYYEAVDFSGKGIVLRSSDGRDVTTIDGSAYDSAVVSIRDVSGSSARLEGFTVRGGSGNLYWAGMKFGGGVHIRSCAAHIADCHILDNHPAAGGGIAFCAAWGTVENCLIEQNTSYGSSQAIGAGIHVKFGPVEIVDTVIRDDHTLAGSRAGGLGTYLAQVSMRNCIIDGNSASLGGACVSWLSSVSMSECTVTNNTAEYGGGALCSMSASSTITATNSILWNNSAAFGPAEVYAMETEAAISVSNSIVRGGYDGENVIDADPLFQENCFRLTPESPAVNAGSNDAVESELDLDGNPRIADPMNTESTPVVDMGAYELQPDDSIPDPGPCPGDVTGDGSIDLVDLLAVIADWGGCFDCEECSADLDDNCVVSISDLLLVIENWGEPCE